MPRVIVSSGHSAANPGITANGLTEYEVARKIAKYTLKYIRMNGVISLLIPPNMELAQRIEWINKTGYMDYTNDVAVEIHINDGNKRGVEIWYEGEGPNKSQDLANAIHEFLTTEGKMQSQGVNSEYKHELGSISFVHEVNPIACLIECGYIDNEEDAKFLKEESNLDLCGKSIAKGIMKYLRLEYREIPGYMNAAPPGSQLVSQQPGMQPGMQPGVQPGMVPAPVMNQPTNYQQTQGMAQAPSIPQASSAQQQATVQQPGATVQPVMQQPAPAQPIQTPGGAGGIKYPAMPPSPGSAVGPTMTSINPAQRPSPVQNTMPGQPGSYPAYPAPSAVPTAAPAGTATSPSAVYSPQGMPATPPGSMQQQAMPPAGSTASYPGYTPQNTREDRKKMITDNYIKILGREPNQNDLNYFLNIGTREDELIRKMIDSQEHADLVKARQEVITMKKEFTDMKTENMQLKASVEDQKNIMASLTASIAEKNFSITKYQKKIKRIEEKQNELLASGTTAGKSKRRYKGTFKDKVFRAFSEVFD